ncbi:hypothetical protein HDU93_008795 [Gonapodya sp. JEL0774]|nr:hypothetical protein HDU93_008795 [Gonapodya sp. JEL0774]
MVFRRSPVAIVALLALVALVSRDTIASPSLARPPCSVGIYDPSKDYFPDQVQPRASTGWKIEYSKSYKVVTNVVMNLTYVLYQCGTPLPSVNLFPKNASYFEIPAYLIGTSSRTMPRFLERLGLREQIHHVPDVDLITSPCLLELERENFTTSLPLGWTTTGVDVVFGRGPNAPNETSVDVRNGLVMVSAVTETNLLAKFEWIKFISAWFNLEGTAESIYSKAANTFQCNSVNLQTATSNFSQIRRPVVAWFGRTPDGMFVTSNFTYKYQAILDAGGSPVVAAEPVNLTTVQNLLKSADVLIDETVLSASLADIASAYGLDASQANATSWVDGNTYPFLYNRRIYQLDRILTENRQTDDFDQSYWAMPDYVQEDLMHILWPNINARWGSIWFRNVTSAGSDVTIATASLCRDGETNSTFSETYGSTEPACHSPSLDLLTSKNAFSNRAPNDIPNPQYAGAVSSTPSSSDRPFNLIALITSLAAIVALGTIVGVLYLRYRSRERTYMDKRGISLAPLATHQGHEEAPVKAPVEEGGAGRWFKLEEEVDVTEQGTRAGANY